MTGGRIEREAQGSSALVSPLWQVLILLIGVFVLADYISHGWDFGTLERGYGTLGVRTLDEPFWGGFVKVGPVTPDGPMAALGVRQGDAIRFDRGIDAERSHRAGERVGFTLRRNGALSHHTVTADVTPEFRVRAAATASAGVIAEGIYVVTCLIGMFATLRSRRRASTLLFGAALVALGESTVFPTLAESDPLLFPAYVVFASALYGAAPLLFLGFAAAARWRRIGTVPWIWRIVFAVYATARVFWVAALIHWELTAQIFMTTLQGWIVATVLAVLGYLLAFLTLGLAWRESRGPDRTRYAFMLIAGALLSVSVGVIPVVIDLTGYVWSLSNPLVPLMAVSGVAGAGVFAYAVLRHRVMDLGFAVNRTLIFAMVSAILLTVFGLIEWAVDHLVPIAGREKNVVVDAAVAVGVFLTFHRARDGVEHVIESLFFSRWQKAEARLRRFVKEAAFATRSETLIGGFAAALGHYAEGAQAAVYLMEDAGDYRRAAGTVADLGEALDPDDPALLAIRAEPRAVNPDETGSALGAALIAPMVNRNEVTGAVVLGPKPRGLDYRPDEIELITWAARQVGLDLNALRVEQLEAAQARQAEQISVLNGKIEVLLAGRQAG